jgi:dipeptidyl-peptidase-3
MAMWHISDPRLRDLGVVTHPDVAKAMYYAQVRAPLIQLRSIPSGQTIEEDHQRNRQLIVEYIMDRVPGAIERVRRDGKTYLRTIDFDKTRQGVGMLLAEIMRIKGEGDYEAGKALVEKYGVHFDPAIRDEIVARYKQLDLPTYWAGIHPDLFAQIEKGDVKAVSMSYPRDIVKQRLRWRELTEYVE